jgi:cytosine/uracil/thiamine/allantoin permease
VTLALDALRIGLAILLDTAALVIWNIGTRSPVHLLADVRAGLHERSAVVRGLVRLAAGALALTAAVAVSAPVATRVADFTIIECWALVIALVIEQLVGPGLRAGRR